ncbi:BQ2448_930 [Microbotryum intermedium]|uniref:BQ2448_930 protein n=1 Tax=Microbotryum intermedium TaxID=269621 RepID=A0A238F7S9_9BASI|nr:BQ2448_930 [Microbotryum intermedium]
MFLVHITVGLAAERAALHARNKVALLAFNIRPMAPSVPKALPVTPIKKVAQPKEPKVQRLATPDSTPSPGERRSSRLREVVSRKERERERESSEIEGAYEEVASDWESEEQEEGDESGCGSARRKRKRSGSTAGDRMAREGARVSTVFVVAPVRLAGHRPNPKIFGHQRGVPVGTRWGFRMECSQAGVHAPVVAGIAGNEHVGAWSVALSGQLGSKVDGDTGSGGRDLKGTSAAPKNLRTAPQTSDQVFTKLNAALKRSVQTRKPVRVIRGFKGHSPWAPVEGYRYDGLYIITKVGFWNRDYWQDVGEAGFKVCKYAFQRMDGQPDIPVRPGREEEAEAIITEFGKGSNMTPPETAAEFRARSIKVESSCVPEVEEEEEQGKEEEKKPVLKVVQEPLTPETSPIKAGRMVRSLRSRPAAMAVKA